MRERPSEVILNFTLAVAALTFTALLLRRELMLGDGNARAAAVGKPAYVVGWERLANPEGDEAARLPPIQLVEFVDYECGFCKLFERTRKQLEREYPGRVAVSFVHFPLPFHRFARAAASAAECARSVGRFEHMHDLLFERQDSIGLKSWGEFASSAGIKDTVSFNACVRSHDMSRRIDHHVELAESLSITATPTLIVNGWKLPLPPSTDELSRIARSLLSGEPWQPQDAGDTVFLSARTASAPR